MVFNSPVFLFAFLPLSLLAYHLLPGRRCKNAFLIAASLVFYAFGNVRHLALLLGSAVVHYLAGLAMLRWQKCRKPVLAVTVMLDAALLLGYKLAGWLPLGVSFFTFQAISYVVDLYRDPADGSRSFREVLQYITFFPQLVSGPLMKFSAARQCFEAKTDAADVAVGMTRFTVGLAKKLLLSAAAASVADAVFGLSAADLDIRTAWLGALCYTLQIFFDFSGYSDMAIGLGRMFGYALPENFRYPYIASSVSDFWRRWHISLSNWFRDYLYIPLGGNRKGKTRTILNKLIVFFATGLWHGVTLPFILWGLLHGLFVAVETAFGLPKKLEKKWYGHVYTLLAVVLTFVFFRSATAAQAVSVIGSMFAGFSLKAAGTLLLTHELGLRTIFFLLLGCVLSTPLASKLRLSVWAVRVLTLLLLVICILTLASGSFVPFIYFQF